MGKYNFRFGDTWLSEFGAVCTEEPTIEIAQRDVSFIDIPGKDGSDCVDNKRYKNVDFTRDIALVGRKVSSANDKAIQLVNNYAYLQGYQPFEDTDHNGLITEAALTNFGDITKSLRTMHTAQLKFTRKPYWYLKESLEEFPLGEDVYNGGVEFINPYPSTACPVIRFYLNTSEHSEISTATINFSLASTYDGVYQTKSYETKNLRFDYEHSILDYDIENRRVCVHSSEGQILSFIDTDVPAPIGAGSTVLKITKRGDFKSASIFLRWRCL